MHRVVFLEITFVYTQLKSYLGLEIQTVRPFRVTTVLLRELPSPQWVSDLHLLLPLPSQPAEGQGSHEGFSPEQVTYFKK